MLTPHSKSNTRHLLDLAIPFVAVGLGAVTVGLFYDPKALLPRPPYWPWLFMVFALGVLGGLFALGLEDGWEDEAQLDQAARWKIAALAYLITLLVGAEFILLSRFLK